MKRYKCLIDDVPEIFEAKDLDDAIEFIKNCVDIHQIDEKGNIIDEE